MNLCQTCCQAMLANAGTACRRCGESWTAEAAEAIDIRQGPCPACRGKKLRFDSVVRLGRYDGALRAAVLRAKRPTGNAVAAGLASLLWQTQAAELRACLPDLILSVPMHWRRRLTRGTNSPEIVAEILSAKLAVPWSNRLLQRRRATSPQGPLSRLDRAANVRGAFAIMEWSVDRWAQWRHRKPAGSSAVAGRRVLLIDDILTSGATCQELARLLKRRGAAWVGVAVLARAEFKG